MPWTASDAPSTVKTPAKRKKWAEIANAVREECIADGGEEKECDAQAKIVASTTVKKKAEMILPTMKIVEIARIARKGAVENAGDE